MAEQQEHPYHVRCISLPARSHPLALRFEEELQKVKTWATEASSSSPSSETLCRGLEGLVSLHECVENLLRMPDAQKAIAHRKNEKWVAEELDGTVRLLDMCGSTRDCLSLMKEYAQDLQSSLRTRRTGDAHAFTCSEKKAAKEIKSCLKTLKQMEIRYPVLSRDDDLSLVLRALKETREVTILVHSSIFSSVSVPTRPKACGWSMVSKAMLKKKVASEGEQCCSSSSLHALYKKISSKDLDTVEVRKLQDQLKELEGGVSALENGLECMYQRLIRNRVTLLNIVNL